MIWAVASNLCVNRAPVVLQQGAGPLGEVIDIWHLQHCPAPCGQSSRAHGSAFPSATALRPRCSCSTTAGAALLGGTEAQAAEGSKAELHFAACVRPFLRENLGAAFSRVLLAGDDYSGWAPKDHGLGRLALHQ